MIGYDDMLWPQATHMSKPADASRIVEAVAGALRVARLNAYAA
jgi:hypothetical protein